jgi:alkyldihydroxyacetonephosphate synthase
MSIDRINNLKTQLMDTINGKWPAVIENDPHLNWKPKQTWFRPDGWGYKDTKFIITKNDCVTLTGNKYTFANKNLPYFVDYCTNIGHANFKGDIKNSQISHIPTPPIVNDDFIAAIMANVSRISFENAERLMHSYGHTLQEMYMLKFGKFGRYCDVVLYPKNNSETEVDKLI